jgi:hypothetical protein
MCVLKEAGDLSKTVFFLYVLSVFANSMSNESLETMTASFFAGSCTNFKWLAVQNEN